MSESIIAALIGGAVALFGTIAYLAVELRKERKEHARHVTQVADAFLATSESVLYPYSTEALRVTVSITDLNGSTVNQKYVEGIRATPGMLVYAVHAEAHTSGTFVEQPRLVSHTRADVVLRGESASEKSYKYEVVFQNGLRPDDKPCSYTVQWSARTSVYVDKQTILATNAEGFHSHNEMMNTPHDYLEITVRWPEPGDYGAFPRVTLGNLDVVSSAERARIEKDFVITPEAAVMRVHKPVVGLNYVIAWRGRAASSAASSSTA